MTRNWQSYWNSDRRDAVLAVRHRINDKLQTLVSDLELIVDSENSMGVDLEPLFEFLSSEKTQQLRTVRREKVELTGGADKPASIEN